MIVPKDVKTYVNSGHYLEGTGDRHHDVELLRSLAQGENVRPEVRVVIGATACMPVRVASYVDTAAMLAARVNASQLRIMYATRLGMQINNLSPDVMHEATQSAAVLDEYVKRAHPEIAQRTGICMDTQQSVDTSVERASNIDLEMQLPKELEAMTSGKGDLRRYLAGHVVYLDSDLLATETLYAGDEYDGATPLALVNLQHQHDRPFTKGRNRVVGDVLLPDEQIAQRAQVYTGHIRPPYLMDLDGDISMEIALSKGLDGHGVGPNVQKDIHAMGQRLVHLTDVLRMAVQ